MTGMGIRQGVTLIVGGGFHGKTTLLKALEAGIYDKASFHGPPWFPIPARRQPVLHS